MTPEGKVKEKIKAVLKKHNVYYFMPRGTGMGRSGIPDFVGCHKGQFFAVEAKSDKGHLTALQIAELDRIVHVGSGRAFVVRGEDSLNFLEEFLQS